jgi:hypothetical protein
MKKSIDFTGIKIQKNVPLKGREGRPKRTTKYPWDEMEVGDMFFVECDEKQRGAISSSVATSGRAWARYNNKPHKLSVRKMDGGFGVWRIA